MIKEMIEEIRLLICAMLFRLIMFVTPKDNSEGELIFNVCNYYASKASEMLLKKHGIKNDCT